MFTVLFLILYALFSNRNMYMIAPEVYLITGSADALLFIMSHGYIY